MKKGIISAALGWSAAVASRFLRKPYLPPILDPHAADAAQELSDAYYQAIEQGAIQGRSVVNAKFAKKSKASGVSGSERAENLRAIGDLFAEAAQSSDPDGLAAELVRLFCIGVKHMDDVDNQRRVVAAWSAILAPSIVMREHSKVPITLECVADAAMEWVGTGTTSDAAATQKNAATRFVARHPARMYELLVDTAAAHSIEHRKLVTSVVQPVLLPIGQYLGAVSSTSTVGVDTAVAGGKA